MQRAQENQADKRARQEHPSLQPLSSRCSVVKHYIQSCFENRFVCVEIEPQFFWPKQPLETSSDESVESISWQELKQDIDLYDSQP